MNGYITWDLLRNLDKMAYFCSKILKNVRLSMSKVSSYCLMQLCLI